MNPTQEITDRLALARHARATGNLVAMRFHLARLREARAAR